MENNTDILIKKQNVLNILSHDCRCISYRPALNKITGSKIFLDYAEKWNSYRNNKKCLYKYYYEFYFYRYKYKLHRIKSFFASF